MSGQRRLSVEDSDDNTVSRAKRLARANINPQTGLATDYLNHFNEAIMLLEMSAASPECTEDFRAWKPISYREHFAISRFTERMVAIEAYDAAPPATRHCLETLADTMTAVLEAIRAALAGDLPPHVAAGLAQRSAAWLKPLVARAGAVINGETAAESIVVPTPQAAIDLLMKR
jgi:hypothetical protein